MLVYLKAEAAHQCCCVFSFKVGGLTCSVRAAAAAVAAAAAAPAAAAAALALAIVCSAALRPV